MWGDSDRVLDPSGASVFEAGISDCQVVLLENVGHAPMIEQPKRTGALMVAFWDSVD